MEKWTNLRFLREMKSQGSHCSPVLEKQTSGYIESQHAGAATSAGTNDQWETWTVISKLLETLCGQLLRVKKPQGDPIIEGPHALWILPLRAQPVSHNKYWHTSEILLWGSAQDHCNEVKVTKSKSNEFFGFLVHIKCMFTLYYSLLSIQ